MTLPAQKRTVHSCFLLGAGIQRIHIEAVHVGVWFPENLMPPYVDQTPSEGKTRIGAGLCFYLRPFKDLNPCILVKDLGVGKGGPSLLQAMNAPEIAS